MGTDSSDVYHGPCPCGMGEVNITFCTPDHPWPTQSKWFETSISCEACSKKYLLVEQGKHFVFAHTLDQSRREEYWHEYSRRADAMLTWPESVALLHELADVLENQKSVAACHRLLSAHQLDYYSISTFRKKWSGGSDWIKNNIRASNLKNVMKLLGRNLKKIEDETKALEGLYEKYKKPLPIVGEPLVDVSRYRQ